MCAEGLCVYVINVCVLSWQIQLGRQVFLAGAHQTSDGDHRCVHHTQFAVAGQESGHAQQTGHDARDLSGVCV